MCGGINGTLSGNVFGDGVVVPFVATGNAAGALADAYSDSNSTADVSSDGSYGTVGSNVLSPYFSTPANPQN